MLHCFGLDYVSTSIVPLKIEVNLIPIINLKLTSSFSCTKLVEFWDLLGGLKLTSDCGGVGTVNCDPLCYLDLNLNCMYLFCASNYKIEDEMDIEEDQMEC